MTDNPEHSVAKTVRHAVESFRQAGLPIIDMHRQTYMVIRLPDVAASVPARTLLIARVMADWVIIYEDRMDKPFVDTLVQKGIPRERVVLVYKGEPLPDFTAIFAPLVKREVKLYAGHAHKAVVYPMLDDERLIYGVVIVPDAREEREVYLINLARVVGDRIVIEEEQIHDKPLYEALIHNAGVPREQIILAYFGEALPEGAP